MKNITSRRYFGVFMAILVLSQSCADLPVKRRIVSGRRADISTFPWQVIIKLSKFDGLRGGGSIISKNWVLTAAHVTIWLRSIYIMFGTTKLNDKNALGMTSTTFYLHPDFNEKNFNNDISVVKLPKPLTYSRYIQPIALIPQKYKEEDFVGSKAIITGFGFVSDGVPNPIGVLLEAEVTIISNAACSLEYADGEVVASTICSKGSTNQAICDGDSGGPLITRDDDGELIQIGIVSYSARASCIQNFPSAYTRVSSFLDYIANTTGISLF